MFIYSKWFLLGRRKDERRLSSSAGTTIRRVPDRIQPKLAHWVLKCHYKCRPGQLIQCEGESSPETSENRFCSDHRDEWAHPIADSVTTKAFMCVYCILYNSQRGFSHRANNLTLHFGNTFLRV